MTKNYIYGINTVSEFLKSSNRLKKVFVTSTHNKLIHFCEKNNIEFEIKDQEFFRKISLNSQGVAAQVSPYIYSKLDLIQKLSNNSTIVVLDQIQDPHNFGAIIRTCVSANVEAIIIANRNQVEINSTVEKTSVGTTTKVPVIKVANIANAINMLKKEGYWVYGTALDSSTVDYRQPDYLGKTAIVIGSEGKGIKPIVKKSCDQTIKIPLANKVESLNTSVATAVILYHIYNVKFPL